MIAQHSLTKVGPITVLTHCNCKAIKTREKPRILNLCATRNAPVLDRACKELCMVHDAPTPTVAMISQDSIHVNCKT